MKKNLNIIFITLFLLLAAVPVFSSDKPQGNGLASNSQSHKPRGNGLASNSQSHYQNILVKRAVDGDTLELATGERVRLIGIDTPEMHESNKLYRDSQRSGQDSETIKALGRRAYEFTRKLTEGKKARLDFDAEKYDKYKRLLAYVYLKDGTFVNAKIVEEGYASLLTIPPNVKYADLFLKLYRQARENKKGLWQ